MAASEDKRSNENAYQFFRIRVVDKGITLGWHTMETPLERGKEWRRILVSEV